MTEPELLDAALLERREARLPVAPRDVLDQFLDLLPRATDGEVLERAVGDSPDRDEVGAFGVVHSPMLPPPTGAEDYAGWKCWWLSMIWHDDGRGACPLACQFWRRIRRDWRGV